VSGLSNIFPHFIPAADYPSRSPELNGMEHIWSWMQARVEDVPQQVVRNCIAAIPERLRLIVAVKDGQILAK
jgi:hypothetical protein